jgi:hypothetical protein
MHATNTFPVDRHPQYRHYPTAIHSIASSTIIEVRKKSHQDPAAPQETYTDEVECAAATRGV